MKRVSIVGASGYSGAELLRILLNHPGVAIDRLCASSSAGKHLAEVVPAFAGRIDKVLEPFSPAVVAESDLVFVALPSGEALTLVPVLLEAGKRVIDLGGDFRLRDTEAYARFYKRTHTAPALLAKAVYGLPEWNANAIRSAEFITNPGCYPTSVILPLVPFLAAGAIAPTGIVVNSLSGVTGAGRSASHDMSFAEVNESVKAYKVGVHQHTPEIEQYAGDFSGRPTTVSFTPHLLPVSRGIYTSIAAPLTGRTTQEEAMNILHTAYDGKPFVRITPGIPEIKHTAMTNYIDIGVRIDERNRMLLLFSTIDNLVKGAAGQAVQNMNLLFGFSETEGLR